MINLIYIYVDDNLRHRGIGRYMINKLVQLCREDEKLLICTFTGEEGSYLIDIFDESGDFAITREDGNRCIAPLGDLVDAMSRFNIDRYMKYLVRYEDLPSGKRATYLNDLAKKGMLNLKYSQASFNKKYSYCCLNDEDMIVGTIIVENLSGDNFYIRLISCKEGYELGGMALVIKCARVGIKDLPPHTLIHMDMVSDGGVKFIKKLLPSTQITGDYYTAVMDDTEWNY